MAEGRSLARGTMPGWASSAADIRVSKYTVGSLTLGLQVPRLADVAPEIFAQQQPFPAGTYSDAKALDLLLNASDDVAAGRREHALRRAPWGVPPRYA